MNAQNDIYEYNIVHRLFLPEIIFSEKEIIYG